MDVLLLNSNFSKCARAGYGATPAPGGLVQIAAVLRRRGHRVRIGQMKAHLLPQDEDSLPLVRDEAETLLNRFPPDVIGISLRNLGAARAPFSPFHLIQYYSAFYDARIVRALRMLSKAPIVIGGTALHEEPELYMKYLQPDYGVLGDGEQALPALLDALAPPVASGAGLGIPGVITAGMEAAYRCEHAATPDLSVLGVGAVDLLENFRTDYYADGGVAPIQTKRGCSLHCTYCTAPSFEGSAYRFRPLEHVVEEMRAYRDLWGARHFFLVDSTFNHPRSHALEFCRAILDADLGVQWFAELNPSCVDDRLVRSMVEAGCIGVSMTPDALSDATLAGYHKGFRMAEVSNAVDLLRKHQVPFDTCVILGGPGETEKSLREGLQYAHDNLRDVVVRFYDGMVIQTRSPCYQQAVEEGLVDASVGYEEIIFRNDFRGIKRYEYYFPHMEREERSALIDFVGTACRQERWLLTSKDYVPDPALGGSISLHKDIVVNKEDRPWFLNLRRNASHAALQPAGQ